MERTNLTIWGLALLLGLLGAIGLSIHRTNMDNIAFIEESRAHLRLLQDPSLKLDGSSLLGTPFVDFVLNDMNGITLQLSRIKALMKVIVLFDTQDCSDCLYEYRLWSTIYQRYRPDIVFVVGICTSRDRNALANFIDARKIKFPVLWDPEKKVRSAMKFRTSPLRILLDEYDMILDIERTLTTTEHQKVILEMVDSRVKSLGR